MIVAVAAGSLALVAAVGIWASTHTRDARDFYIAGQRVGLVVTGLTTMSAAFSGFVFLGGPGLTYRMGAGALWIVAPVGFTAGLLGWVAAGPLRRMAGEQEIFTVPDAIRVRFGNGAGGLSAVAVAVGSLAYLGAQLLALGILLQAVFGIERLWVAMSLGTLVLLVYSVFGGMLAGVYTDVVQGVMMLVAAVLVFNVALDVTGGWTGMLESIASSDSFEYGFTDPFLADPFVAFGFFFVFGVGVLGQPQMLHKFFMLDDERKLRWFPLVLGSSQTVCLLIWVGVGFAVPALVARGAMMPLERPDDATMSFLLGQTPEAIAGLALAAALAAIMSTADSFLNIGAAAIVRDLPRAFGKRVNDELAAGRIAVVCLALAAVAVALLYGDLIALLGTLAFGTFAAALAPTIAVGLNWDGVTPAAATSSIAVGLATNLGLELLPVTLASGALPSVIALSASFATLLLVSLSTRRTRYTQVPGHEARCKPPRSQ